LSGCDSVLQFFTGSNDEEQKSYIYQSDDKSVTVVSANPKPADINKDGFTFNVSLKLPYNANGYYVWIMPDSYTSPSFPIGESKGYWYKSSKRYSATETNIVCGGWLCSYNDTTDTFTYIREGTVFTWNMVIKRINADLSTTLILDEEFAYKVEVE
jgi:hypothetical protein